MRGVDGSAVIGAKVRYGSSPHAWGRRINVPSVLIVVRFIPTCVGQTYSRSAQELVRPVHPHMRGADSTAWPSVRSYRSVHPHMRGADVSGQLAASLLDRFIPTCVGQTFRNVYDGSVAFGSSPRAWGRQSVRLTVVAGISVHPHVRGADGTQGALQHLVLRFIPTCVGQTFSGTASQDLWVGSSPHAWGRPVPEDPHVVQHRFIPTCVGQTRSAAARSAVFCGSSPHAWGRRPPPCGPGHQSPVHPHMRGAD